MPKQTFAFEQGGQSRLELSWKGMFKNMDVRLDGMSLGVIPDRKALIAGQEFRLTDGSILKVQQVNKFTGAELQVLRNGQPLPGSASNPETRVKTAAGIIFFIAALNLIFGFLAVLVRSDFLQSLGLGWGSVIFGLFFLVMGFLVMRRSYVALILAIIIFALDMVVGIVLSIAAGTTPSIGGLVFRVFLILPMIQGLGAIKALKKENVPPPM